MTKTILIEGVCDSDFFTNKDNCVSWHQLSHKVEQSYSLSLIHLNLIYPFLYFFIIHYGILKSKPQFDFPTTTSIESNVQ